MSDDSLSDAPPGRFPPNNEKSSMPHRASVTLAPPSRARPLVRASTRRRIEAGLRLLRFSSSMFFQSPLFFVTLLFPPASSPKGPSSYETICDRGSPARDSSTWASVFECAVRKDGDNVSTSFDGSSRSAALREGSEACAIPPTRSQGRSHKGARRRSSSSCLHAGPLSATPQSITIAQRVKTFHGLSPRVGILWAGRGGVASEGGGAGRDGVTPRERSLIKTYHRARCGAWRLGAACRGVARRGQAQPRPATIMPQAGCLLPRGQPSPAQSGLGDSDLGGAETWPGQG